MTQKSILHIMTMTPQLLTQKVTPSSKSSLINISCPTPLLRPSNTHNTELMKSVSQERGLLGQAGLGRCQMTSYVNLIVLMRMLFTRSRIMSEAGR